MQADKMGRNRKTWLAALIALVVVIVIVAVTKLMPHIYATMPLDPAIENEVTMVMATNDILGYAYTDELEEASDSGLKTTTIKVYAGDGKTVIGEFVIGGEDVQSTVSD